MNLPWWVLERLYTCRYRRMVDHAGIQIVGDLQCYFECGRWLHMGSKRKRGFGKFSVHTERSLPIGRLCGQEIQRVFKRLAVDIWTDQPYLPRSPQRESRFGIVGCCPWFSHQSCGSADDVHIMLSTRMDINLVPEVEGEYRS